MIFCSFGAQASDVESNLLANGGFESKKVPSGVQFEGGVVYVEPWVKSSLAAENGGVGISLSNSSPWLGAPNDGVSAASGCPEGSQFAYLQVYNDAPKCGISQDFEATESGVYRFSAQGRCRYRYNDIRSSGVVVSVYVDDTLLMRRQFGPRGKHAPKSSFPKWKDALNFQPFLS